MADHSKPTVTSTYANYTSELDGRLDDLALGLDPATTSPTNVPTNAIRWASASNKWQKWNGSAWGDLSGSYSININGTVGATTPAAGSFTSITNTGGTANGVTYLNGSKVLTSGSALTFDGSTFTTTAGIEGTKLTTAGNISLYNSVSSQLTHYQQLSSAYTASYIQSALSGASSSLVFAVNSNWTNSNAVEGMRLTSTGLGIGTSSPVAKLAVVGGTSNASNLSTAYSLAAFNITPKSTSGYSLQFGSGPADVPYIQMSAGGAAAGNLLIQPYGGNVGVGVTYPLGKLSVNTGSTTAALFVQTGGTTASYSLAEFRTGTNLPALVIKGNGSVGVGTDSPNTYVNSQGATLAVGSWPNFATIQGRTDGPSGAGNGVSYGGSYQSNPINGARIFMGASGGAGQQGIITFNTKNLDDNSTQPPERVRIDSSGNLLVGATSGGGKLTVTGTGSSGWVSNFVNSGTGTIASCVFTNGNGVVGSIQTSGSSTFYNTSSDYRLKEDWQPMTGASERVKALKPVNFAWKVDGSRVDGFLAHEAQAVVPEAVVGEKDAVDAEGKPVYQGIDQSKLVPLLTAALQEALAKIESLTARVSALEGN